MSATPTAAVQNKFDNQFAKAIKRPHYPYGSSSNTTSTSGSGSAGSGSTGSGSGSGLDNVQTLKQQLGKTSRSDSGSNSDSLSRSRSLSPLRRLESLQDQDELISSDDSGPSTTKYRRLSDPSGASRMDTDSRKSPSPSVTPPRTYATSQSSRPTSYHRSLPPSTPLTVMTSSMHGTESVCCRC